MVTPKQKIARRAGYFFMLNGICLAVHLLNHPQGGIGDVVECIGALCAFLAGLMIVFQNPPTVPVDDEDR